MRKRDILKCPVCSKKLIEDVNRFYCNNNHSFDKGKSGYINLLLNQTNSGDNKIMVDARYQILEKGYYDNLLLGIIEVLKKYNINSLLDVGCGDGYYSTNIKRLLEINVVGMDVSKYACLKASKRAKDILFVVASIFDMPFENNEFEAILSNFTPHDEKEFKRVSKNYIIKVIPNKNHLFELKELLYENVFLKEEKIPVFESFRIVEEKDIKYKKIIDDAYSLIKMTPYFYKTKIEVENVENVKIDVSMDFKVLVYKKIGE